MHVASRQPPRAQRRHGPGGGLLHGLVGEQHRLRTTQTAGGARVTVDFGEGKGVKTFTGDAPMIKIG